MALLDFYNQLSICSPQTSNKTLWVGPGPELHKPSLKLAPTSNYKEWDKEKELVVEIDKKKVLFHAYSPPRTICWKEDPESKKRSGPAATLPWITDDLIQWLFYYGVLLRNN